MPGRPVRFVLAFALLGAAAWALHLGLDPVSRPGDTADPLPWEPAERVADFFLPVYGPEGDLAWTVRGAEAILEESGSVRLHDTEVRRRPEPQGDGAELVLSAPTALLEVQGLDIARFRKGLAPRPGSRNRLIPEGEIVVRFPDAVTGRSAAGLSFRTTGLVCRVGTAGPRTPPELAKRARIETDRPAIVEGPGLEASATGLAARGEDATLVLARDVVVDLDARVRALPGAGGAFGGGGGLRLESPHGAVIALDPGILQSRPGPLHLTFPGPVTGADRAGPLGADGDETRFRAGRAEVEGRFDPGEDGTARLSELTLDAADGVTLLNLGPGGRVEAAFASQTLRLGRNGRMVACGGRTLGWIAGRGSLRSGLFNAPYSWPEGEPDECLRLQTEDGGEFTLEERGGGLALRAPGPFSLKAFRSFRPPLLDGPVPEAEALGRSMDGALEGARLESEARGGSLSCGFWPDRDPATRILEIAKGAELRDFGADPERPDGTLRADAVRCVETEEDRVRTAVLSATGLSFARRAGARFVPFGARAREGVSGLHPDPADDRFSLRLEGGPETLVRFRSVAARDDKGKPWRETERELTVEGPSAAYLETDVGEDEGSSVEGSTFMAERSVLRFRPEGEGPSVRWVPWSGEHTGNSHVRFTDARGARSAFTGTRTIRWETVEEDGGTVDAVRTEGLGSTWSMEFPAGEGPEGGAVRGFAGSTAGLVEFAGRRPAGGAQGPWERARVSARDAVVWNAWDAGGSAADPSWILEADAAAGEFVPAQARAGQGLPGGLRSLDATGNVQFRQTGAHGRAPLEARGTKFRVEALPEGAVPLEGFLAGPATLLVGRPQAGEGADEKSPWQGGSWACVETGGALEFSGALDGPWHFDCPEGVVAAAVGQGPIGDERTDLKAGRARFDLRPAPGRSGWSELAWACGGGVEGERRAGSGAEGPPLWRFTAHGAQGVFSRSSQDSGGGAVLESLRARGEVRILNYGAEGSAKAWGEGETLVLVRDAANPEAWTGTLTGPAEFYVDGTADLPPLQGKGAERFRWARLATPGTLDLAGAGLEGGREGTLSVRAGEPAVLSFGVEPGRREARAGASWIRMEASALRLVAARGAGAGDGWVVQSCAGEGRTVVTERGQGFTVTATGTGVSLGFQAGAERFRGADLRVHVTPD